MSNFTADANGVLRYSAGSISGDAGSAIDANFGVVSAALSAKANAAIEAACLCVTAGGNDSTAQRGRPDLPFATLNAAAAAAVSGDTIHVGIGTFAPLTVTLPAWVRIVGAGKPHVDSVTAPTTLVGGSVIRGPLVAIYDGFELSHAGVDCGTAVCTSLYGGSPQDALAVSNVPTQTVGVTPLKAPRISDVICLAQSPTAPVHACRVENVQQAIINGIETWFGVHGLAFKGINSNISNHVANGHGSTSHYLKSDTYAPCGNVNSTNISANVVGGSGASVTGAVCVDGYTASIGPVNLSNVTISAGFSVGMEFNAVAGMSCVNLVNVEITGATTPFVYNSGAQILIFPQNVTVNGTLLPALGSFRSVSFDNGNGGPTVSTGCLEFVSGVAFLLGFGANTSTIGAVTLGVYSSDFSQGLNGINITSTGVAFGALAFPFQASSAPSYAKGAIYFDTNLNKLRVGGASGWETVTSA